MKGLQADLQLRTSEKQKLVRCVFLPSKSATILFLSSNPSKCYSSLKAKETVMKNFCDRLIFDTQTRFVCETEEHTRAEVSQVPLMSAAAAFPITVYRCEAPEGPGTFRLHDLSRSTDITGLPQSATRARPTTHTCKRERCFPPRSVSVTGVK